MSRQGQAAATRAIKRNNTKRERQNGDKIVRDAVDAMHAEMAEAAETAKSDLNAEPEDGEDIDD